MVPEQTDETRTPGYREHYNVNPTLKAENKVDEDGNPTGGSVNLRIGENRNPLRVQWQDGPRGQVGTDELLPPNGAFVEDVLWAALQRLEFFNAGKFRCRENSIAITKIEEALFILKDRQLSRSERNVEGKHEV